MKVARLMTSHNNAEPPGSDFRTCDMICNEDPVHFQFGKSGHSYGRLVREKVFTDELNMNEHIIGIHGYI